MTVKQYPIDLKIVPIVTFMTGFFTFLTLSIYYEVFWMDSKYDVPLIYNMSVMLGDSILLPIINYKIFNLFFNLLRKQVLNKQFVFWGIFGLLISILINYYSHRFWTQDQFTDFIGFSIGTYSIIGYWHLIFSILQVFILMIFPYLWYQSIQRNNFQAMRYARNIWNYFFY